MTPSTGALKRPEHLKVKDHIAGAIPAFDWSKVLEDNAQPIANEFGILDKEQGSSLSCTSQSTAYGIFKKFRIDISRHDLYGQTHLPGGGAYLNAPLDYLRKNGYVLLSKYPDPIPETEQEMETILIVKDADRVRGFTLSYSFFQPTIDNTAQAISQNDFVIIGIDMSFVKGWDKTWTDPTYIQNDDQHALFAGQAVIRNGKKAIKCKSSWTEHTDPSGQRSYAHFINEDYYSGVFEVIGVNIKEINMQLIQTPDKTIYIQSGISQVKILGIADEATLALFGDEPIVQVESLPVVESFTITQGFLINKK